MPVVPSKARLLILFEIIGEFSVVKCLFLLSIVRNQEQRCHVYHTISDSPIDSHGSYRKVLEQRMKNAIIIIDTWTITVKFFFAKNILWLAINVYPI